MMPASWCGNSDGGGGRCRPVMDMESIQLAKQVLELPTATLLQFLARAVHIPEIRSNAVEFLRRNDDACHKVLLSSDLLPLVVGVLRQQDCSVVAVCKAWIYTCHGQNRSVSGAYEGCLGHIMMVLDDYSKLCPTRYPSTVTIASNRLDA